MKKMFFSMVVALIMATTSFAQNTLVAVLSHGTDVQMFYGTNAFTNAVGAAVSGDVITLSAGTFNAANINKGITIRGMGVSTYLGGFSVTIPESDSNLFMLEGVSVSSTININGSTKGCFAKCSISTISFNSASSADVKMVNCSVSKLTLDGASNLKLSNCIVSSLSNTSNTTSKADVFNCYLRYASTEYVSTGKPYRCSFVNCLFYSTSSGIPSSISLPADASAMNCLFVTSGSGGTRIDCYNATVKVVFASYENMLVDSRYNTYAVVPTTNQLSEEAKTMYLGTDGTEVGIYGGLYPYSLTPTYPLITKLNVAKQATADNKLSVEIEVTAAE